MSTNQSYEEKVLLSRIAQGDEFAYKILFDAWWDRMYANTLHFTKQPELAQDLTQEIFIKVWLQRHKLPAVQRFEAFLYTLARNLIIDELRRIHKSPEYHEFFDAYFELSDEHTVTPAEVKDLEKLLHQAIERLPDQMQTAFKLSRFEGLSHEQIAEQMNISRVTSQNYIARAILSIRKYLSGMQSEWLLIIFLLTEIRF